MDETCNEELCREPSCAPGPRAIVRDRVAAAAALLWLGVVWVAEMNVGAGLLGVAAIVLAGQLARKARGFKAKNFWVVVGLSFGAVGAAAIAGIEIPPGPYLLIFGGVILLLSLLVRKGLRDTEAAAKRQATGQPDGSGVTASVTKTDLLGH